MADGMNILISVNYTALLGVTVLTEAGLARRLGDGTHPTDVGL